MEAALIIGVPVVFIVAITVAFKLKSPLQYVVIAALGIFSTFVVDFIHCSILASQCEPDALNVAGWLIQSILVIAISSLVYALIPSQRKSQHRSR